MFSYFTIEDMAATLRKSQTTIKTSLSALEQVDLICRARQGTGNPNRIYVKVPADFSTQTEEKLSVRQSENRPFDRQNSVRQTVRKLSPNNKEKKMKKMKLAVFFAALVSVNVKKSNKSVNLVF